MMSKVKDFFIDRLIYILFMLCNSVCITIFYIFTVGKDVGIIYPIIITLFFISAFLSIDWLRYSYFNGAIENIKNDKNTKLKASTKEQKRIALAIREINLKHAEKEQNILTDYEKKIYFLSGAIHKFKNYISVIQLIIEKNKYKSEELQAILNDIECENNNLFFSLDQVLNYIRLDSFSNDFEVVKVNLYEEIKDIINSNKTAFINNDLFPILKSDTKDALIVTDKKWNRVIIEQIISNAIKYSLLKEESKNLYFEIEKEDKNTVLRIKDEGIGIPSYDLKKVFLPFFTGENGRKIRNSSGIGLYLVNEISSRLNHEISIESKVNEGTEVRIKYLSKM